MKVYVEVETYIIDCINISPLLDQKCGRMKRSANDNVMQRSVATLKTNTGIMMREQANRGKGRHSTVCIGTYAIDCMYIGSPLNQKSGGILCTMYCSIVQGSMAMLHNAKEFNNS